MSDFDFPFVDVPNSLMKEIGKPDKGTRMFRKRGDHEDQFRAWVKAVNATFGGDLLPSNWAPDYVGVSRAAVHKRAQTGKLTAFIFNLTQPALPILRKKFRVMREQYVYLFKSECDAWREEIAFRRARSRSGKIEEDLSFEGEENE